MSRVGVAAVQSGDDMHSVFVRLQSLHGLCKGQPAERTAFLQIIRDAGQRIETMVLQKENDPFGAARSLNDWSVSGPGKAGKQTSAEQRTDTGRHSMKHFSTIDHNVLFSVLITENHRSLFHSTSTSQKVKAGMPFFPYNRSFGSHFLSVR